MSSFLKMDDVEITAVCDVYQPHLDGKHRNAGDWWDPKWKKYKDFRKLLEDKNVDAVLIGTPDHWHAIQHNMACEAGKDIYIEKPLSLSVVEGRKMVESARKNKRVVQVGMQRRTSQSYTRLQKLIAEGGIGKVTVFRSYRISNMYPDGIGNPPDSAPPADLDWDMWQGPAQAVPYNENYQPYKFRWHPAYSSQMTNWGVHFMDAFRWTVGEDDPIAVSAHGGNFAVKDNRGIPDTLEVTYTFGCGALFVFGQYEASNNPGVLYGQTEWRGTKGTACGHYNDIKVFPETGGQFQDPKPRMAELTFTNTVPDTDLHVRNFLDCVKSREKPTGDIEVGHRSNAAALLGNIAYATQEWLKWDPKKEKFTNSDKANKLLHYEYRKPWKLT
jgi:predicted dehydrogenase